MPKLSGELANANINFFAMELTENRWLAAVGLLLLSIATVLSLMAIRPRLWNKTPIGFIFWESIGGHQSASAFSQAIHKTTAHGRTNAPTRLPNIFLP
jgi:hypothetical protein